MLPLLALKVLILAGGIDAEQNHNSHKAHVDRMLTLLDARGVPESDIAVFWADGADPAPDRNVRESPWPDGWWLVAGTPIGDEIEPKDAIKNTTFDRPVQPANRDALKAWLAQTGPTLTAEDTLLIAVTDHGSPDPEGGANTSINLWGEEIWTTKDLLADLGPVPEEARVVLWMSQCYSGGFADLYRHRKNLCGSFSANPDRVAYGCYSDLARRDDVGHFHRLLTAFERHSDIAAATDEVMLTDDTPDTPHLTSDALLFDALHDRAETSGTPVDLVIDARVHEAPADHPARALIAFISTLHGLGALDGYGAAVRLAEQMIQAQYLNDAWVHRWQRADKAHRSLFAEKPARRSKTLKAPKTRKGKVAAQIRLGAAAKKAFEAMPKPAQARLRALRNHKRNGFRLDRRADLFSAIALRVAYLYARIAGPAALDREMERRYDALRTCETTPILPEPLGELPPLPLVKPQALVAHRMGADVDALRPGYLGIAYRDQPKFKGVTVNKLWPASPAAASNLEPGDLLLSMNGEPIRGKGEFVERVLLARPGTWIEFEGRRGRKPLKEKVRVAGLAVPTLPPMVGEMVPPLRLTPYDSAVPLPRVGEGRLTVLFFWATWCKPCKRALPALKAYAQAHGAQIIAITDEGRSTVRRFLKKNRDFGLPIALDAVHEAGRLFNDDKRPTFALIGTDRRLLQFAVGYDNALPIDAPPRPPQ